MHSLFMYLMYDKHSLFYKSTNITEGGRGGPGDKASPRAEHNVMYRIIVHVQSAISLNLD